MKRLALCVVVVLMLGNVGQTEGAIIIDSGFLRVRSEDHPGSAMQNIINPTFGLSISDTATDGDATSQATYNLTNAAGVANFDIVFNQQSFNAGGHLGYADGEILFTLTEAATYNVSGGYSGTGTDTGDGFSSTAEIVGVYLERDRTVGTSANFTFDDVAEGNNSPAQSGTRTGVLTPGSYTFKYTSYAHDRDGDLTGSGSASGSVRLTLNESTTPNVVPEPISLVVWSLISLSFAGVGWWRRQRAA